MHGPRIFFHYLFNRELNELYVSIAIRSFALSLIGLFVPIYLYKIGFSLSYIALFYLILFGVFTLFAFPTAKLCSKIGIKHTMLISIPLTIAGYLLLNLVPTYGWLFWLVPILFGICVITFWLGFHIDFSRFSQRKFRTEQIGVQNILCSIVAAMGPILGALIIIFFGFTVLFITGSALLFVSIIPLFLSKELFPSHNFSFKRFNKQIKISEGLSFMGAAIEQSVASYLWPLFLFIILDSFLDIGIIFTITLFLSLISTVYISKVSDKKSKKPVLKLGVALNSFGWIIRLFFRSVVFITGITFFYGVSATMMGLPFAAITYDNTNKRNRLEYLTFREICFGLGRLVLFSLFFIFISFKLSFVLAALASIAVILIINKNKKHNKK